MLIAPAVILPEGVIAAIIALRPSDAHFASDHVIDTPKSLTSRFGASARRSRPGRSSGFHAIAATSAIARSKALAQSDASRDDEFGCAPALQFDGAARSIPTAARCGSWVRCFGPLGALRWSASA